MINTANRRLQRQLSGLPDTLSAGEHNAIDSALDIYLDIINHFLRILRILARSRSRD